MSELTDLTVKPELDPPTGPAPDTTAQYTAALGQAVSRPTPLMMPAFEVRAAFGEFADETLLSGQRAIPAVLERSGFEFRHQRVDSMKKALGEARTTHNTVE